MKQAINSNADSDIALACRIDIKERMPCCANIPKGKTTTTYEKVAAKTRIFTMRSGPSVPVTRLVEQA